MATDWSRAVHAAAEVLAADPELEDDDAVKRLPGFPEADARVAVTMVAIAFGRVVLSERGVTTFSGTFHVQDKGGAWVPFEFASQPAFEEATHLAVMARHRGTIERAAFDAIAARSVEMGRTEPAPIALLDVTPEMFAKAKPWWKF